MVFSIRTNYSKADTNLLENYTLAGSHTETISFIAISPSNKANISLMGQGI